MMGHRRPAVTAHAVALARAIGLRELRDPIAAEVLPVPEATAARIAGWMTSTPAARAMLRILSAGLLDHAALRMAAVDRAVTEAVDDGCEQVVLLGAGLDTRAWRLEALTDARVIEVDRPAVQEAKRRRIEGRRSRARDVRFAGADLVEDDLGEVLETAGHDPARPTAWVWEAVAVYLPRDTVATVLDVVGERSASGSRLAMTIVSPDLVHGPLAGPLAQLARVAFGAIGEPLRTLLDDAEAHTMIAGVGFDVEAVTAVPDWARAHRVSPPLDLFDAERLVLARRS